MKKRFDDLFLNKTGQAIVGICLSIPIHSNKPELIVSQDANTMQSMLGGVT